MKPDQPPRLATWILEHLTTGEHGLALSGDLCEQYNAGRSAAWYWRQTLAACAVSWFESLRGRASLLVFALLWSILSPAWNALCSRIQTDQLQNRLSILFGPIWIIPDLAMWVLLHALFLWSGLLAFRWLSALTRGAIDRHKFKRAFLWSPVLFTFAYGALFLVVSLYWYSFFEPFQLHTSALSQITDLRLFADVIRFPYLVALIGSLWPAIIRPSVTEAGDLVLALTGKRAPDSTPVRNVDLEGMGGFLGFFVSAGLLNAAIVAILLCRLPATNVPSLLGTLARATIYVLLGAAAGVAGAWFYWRRSASPFRAHAPIPFHLFALICVAGWVWVPAIILLSTQDSAAAGLLGALLGCIVASGLRKSIRAEARSLEPSPATKAIFAQALLEVPTELHGYVIAVSIYLAFYSYRSNSNLTAAALLATGAFLFLWNRTPAPAWITQQQLSRRARLRLIRTAIPAILITAWALMLGVAHRNQIAAEGAALANTAARENSIARAEPTLGGAGGYHSIILWPFPPKKQIIPPIPRPANFLGIDHSRPMVIRFDGNYWYFQPPDQRPGRLAHQAHGNPLLFDIHSNNRFPLFMEAHQRLIGPVRLNRCREIDLEIQNRDNGPGSFSISLLLGDSCYPGQPTLALGQQPVISSQPGYFRFKLAPVTETLRFALPAAPKMRKFDEITVMVIPEREHIIASPKIAVDQFELLPR